MKQKVAVLGAGSWGSALAKCLSENGHDVTLWGNHQQQIDEINRTHTNEQYLKNITLPTNIFATTDTQKALQDVDAVVFVVPTNAVRSVCETIAPYLSSRPMIIHAGKGLEQGTNLRISEVIEQQIDRELYKEIVVLSGPSHAEEVARKDITTITAASKCIEASEYTQKLFMNHYFRVYTNTDIIGVELGAALKNIIAIGAGVINGIGFGDNAKAALVTRGLVEITRFGLQFGALQETFSGLSGVGDLIVTCTSIHSRNWQFGNLIGKGLSKQEALDKINMAVEGVYTVEVVYDIAQKHGIDMPITQAIYEVIYDGVLPKNAIESLMNRDGKSERYI
ncbi:NAD(P)H-dependent glycerol-3-phosphate dehydrogenase [Carnobacteriaceae bacterium zg-ZUI252]|nr:NAD(P)H-dependent glycerol-3-phosphate dehydrogenase [Carnobacteriaceae bacterium zg-ZUI252]MBS4769817.1 NAD(P)H-dependent glycerol-3-phosphate dehydrogenase [Carnobacteriaceae bacterium zg-ZUI240]QTU82667.1 NAD(P)H-dependent glycerol-3-phosphate dehydrogenase [Carnobacteriaceae bacterium zg-C25]